MNGPKFKYWQGGTTLREHGRAETKERQTEMGQKIGTVVLCYVARSCHVALGGRATWKGRATCRFSPLLFGG